MFMNTLKQTDLFSVTVVDIIYYFLNLANSVTALPVWAIGVAHTTANVDRVIIIQTSAQQCQ